MAVINQRSMVDGRQCSAALSGMKLWLLLDYTCLAMT